MPHVSLITLAVADVARARAFYEAWGWEASPASGPEIGFLHGSTAALALFGAEDFAADAGVPLGAPDAAPRSALAMNVGSPAAVDVTIAAAVAAGATVTQRARVADWGGYTGCLRDPDGHVWEIAHNPGFPLRPDGGVELPGSTRSLAYPDPPLGDEVVALGAWTDDDLACVELASDDGMHEGTTLPETYSDVTGRAWIRRQQDRVPLGQGVPLAIRDAGGEALGFVGLFWHDTPGNASIGYWLVPSARGRGLAARAAGLLARWGLREAGLVRIEALVEPGNDASARTLDRIGFRHEGLLRSRLAFADRRADAHVWSLVSGDLDHVG